MLWPDKERQWEGALGQMLKALPQLLALGEKASLEARWTSSMPSVTASGKAWRAPVAHFISGGEDKKSTRWFTVFMGQRINSHDLTLAEKIAARGKP